MGVMIVEYDLSTNGRQRYDELIEKIKEYDCVKITKSCWAIYHETEVTEDVFNSLNQFLGANDKMAVMNKAPGSHVSGTIGKRVADFFNKYKPNE